MSLSVRKRGFTLAEAIITIVIIGVIAALTIPAIIVNTEQHEYKTALKKALSTLNQAIELNVALEGYGPVEIERASSSDVMITNDASIYNFFRKRLNVISTSNAYKGGSEAGNVAFFTAEGMRFEFPTAPSITNNASGFSTNNGKCAHPATSDEEKAEDESGVLLDKPCLVIVDVNGERKPNPQKTTGSYKVPSATGRAKVLDVFPIMITDTAAIPYGVVAQRALFQND